MSPLSGKELRLQRLFKHAGRLLAVPMDHGLTLGPVSGLEQIHRTVEAVAAGGADAVIVHKGLAHVICDYMVPYGCELIVHLSASTSLAPDPDRKELVASVEQAVKLGASAVSAHVNLGARLEGGMLKDLGILAEKCDRWGMPLLAMMYVRDGTRESAYDSEKIRLAARVAAELGADIIKVNYTGTPECFASVVNGAAGRPVIIAGGPKMESEEELLSMIRDAVRAGAAGVAIGRNVFQSSDPRLLTSTIRRLLDSPGI